MLKKDPFLKMHYIIANMDEIEIKISLTYADLNEVHQKTL